MSTPTASSGFVPAPDPVEPPAPAGGIHASGGRGSAFLRSAAGLLYLAFLVRLVFLVSHPAHTPAQVWSTFGLGVAGLGLSIADHLTHHS